MGSRSIQPFGCKAATLGLLTEAIFVRVLKSFFLFFSSLIVTNAKFFALSCVFGFELREVCMIQSSCGHAEGSWAASGVAVAVFECAEDLGEAGEEGSASGSGGKFEILDMDFFDEESLVLVYRSTESEREGERELVLVCV